jgi:hypothetical protein
VTRWLSGRALKITGVVAAVGLLLVLLNGGPGLFFTSSCQGVELASAVSPRGDRVAGHERSVCKGPPRIAHTIYIKPTRVVAGDTYHGYRFFEDAPARERRVEPAILAWVSDDEVSVVYPRGFDHLDSVEISGVTLRAAVRVELE